MRSRCTWMIGKKNKNEGEDIQWEQWERKEENGKRKYFGNYERNK